MSFTYHGSPFGIPPFLPILFILFFVACLVVGVIFILRAIWALRAGERERSFILNGVIGVLLILLPWGLVWIFMIGVPMYMFSHGSPGF